MGQTRELVHGEELSGHASKSGLRGPVSSESLWRGQAQSRQRFSAANSMVTKRRDTSVWSGILDEPEPNKTGEAGEVSRCTSHPHFCYCHNGSFSGAKGTNNAPRQVFPVPRLLLQQASWAAWLVLLYDTGLGGASGSGCLSREQRISLASPDICIHTNVHDIHPHVCWRSLHCALEHGHC